MAGIKRSINGEPGWVTIVKPGDTNRTSTTTVADDPDLLFTMEIGSYFIDLFVNLYIRSNPDFKYSLGLPAGFFRAMQRITAWNTTITQDIITAAPTNVAIDATAGENYGFLRIMGPYSASSAGTFSFKWAQNTSDGSNAATVVAGSALRYFKF